jgi:hypothetical protein
MKVLMLGDIVSRPGRQLITELLLDYKQKNDIDWVIANGENLAGGVGLNKKTVQEMFAAGVDILTSGNHIFRRAEAYELLANKNYSILRPANYPPDTIGQGWRVFSNHLGQNILVINLLGRVFFRDSYDCPFRTADQILSQFASHHPQFVNNLDGIFIDFHAESTSEKISLANYLTGRVTAICGTHTHVPTCDEKILDDFTAFVSDLGMVGAVDSCLGVEKNITIKQFLTQLPQKFMWKTSGPSKLTGVLIKTKKGSIKALSIKRISLEFDN